MFEDQTAENCGPWFDPNHPLNAVVQRRPSIEELERLLNSEEDVAITILPNGQIVATERGQDIGDKKPLTYRENLGGEYGLAA